MDHCVLIGPNIRIGHHGVDYFIKKLFHVIDDNIIVALGFFSFCKLFLRFTLGMIT